MNTYSAFKCCGAALLIAATSPVLAMAECVFTDTITVPPNPATETAPKHAYGLQDGSRIFLGQFFIDADGAPKAYHRNDALALDNLSNAGAPGNWWALATSAKDCGPKGKPVVQKKSDPAPGYYVSMTSMIDDSIADCRRQGRYVDASKIPYVALSPRIRSFNDDKNSGALALVFSNYTGKRAFAVFADQAPDYGFGEGSIALGKALGLDPDPKTGGTDVHENLFVIFRPEIGFPRNPADIESKGKAAFEAWGGEAKLSECMKALKSSEP